MSEVDFSLLNRAGLNLQAVFDIDALPAEMADKLRQGFDPERRYRQLILVGHGGKLLWARVQAAGLPSEHPIDDFSVATVRSWFAAHLPGRMFSVVYPGDGPVGLQALGRLAGWHHASPFMIGINAAWGTWFAYRAVVLADTSFAPTPPLSGESPCLACAGQSCIAACPGGALAAAEFSLPKCVAYRKAPDSRCQLTCVARTRCPVGAAHRYDDAQLAHSYSRSLRMIEQYD